MKKILLLFSLLAGFSSLFAQISLTKKTLYYNGANGSEGYEGGINLRRDGGEEEISLTGASAGELCNETTDVVSIMQDEGTEAEAAQRADDTDDSSL